MPPGGCFYTLHAWLRVLSLRLRRAGWLGGSKGKSTRRRVSSAPPSPFFSSPVYRAVYVTRARGDSPCTLSAAPTSFVAVCAPAHNCSVLWTTFGVAHIPVPVLRLLLACAGLFVCYFAHLQLQLAIAVLAPGSSDRTSSVPSEPRINPVTCALEPLIIDRNSQVVLRRARL